MAACLIAGHSAVSTCDSPCSLPTSWAKGSWWCDPGLGAQLEAQPGLWHHPQPLPHGHRFLHNRDKALLCGAHTTRRGLAARNGNCSFSIKCNLSPFNWPPDSFKSGWVGGAVKPQPIKSLTSCRFLWREASMETVSLTLCALCWSRMFNPRHC